MKKTILLVIMILTLLLFAGCQAADLGTVLTINDSFSGERVMTLDFTNGMDQLSYVKGGIGGIAGVAEKNLPDGLTMKKTKKKITFTMAFSSYDDYSSKINTLLQAGSSGKKAEIVFEDNGTDNPFKKGIVFRENFSSSDLLDWLGNALEKSGIVDSSYGKSDWIDDITCTTVINGKKYEGSGTGVDTSKYNCFETASVDTVLNGDGTVSRDIIIYASQDTIDGMMEEGIGAEEYLKSLCTEEIEFYSEANDWGTNFIFKFSSDDMNKISELTNTVLAGTESDFQMEVSADELYPGYAVLKIVDCADASYYIDTREGKGVKLSYNIPGYCELAGNGQDSDSFMSGSQEENQFTAFINGTSKVSYESILKWKPNYSDGKIDFKVKSPEDVVCKMDFDLLAGYENNLLTTALDGINKLAESCNASVKTGKDKVSLEFSGSMKDVVVSVNQFIANYSGEEFEPASVDEYSDEYNSYANGDYLSMSYTSDTQNTSWLKKSANVNVEYNLKPFVDELTLNSVVSGGLLSKVYNAYYFGDDDRMAELDPDNTTEQYGSLDVNVVSYNILPIILLVLIIVAAIIAAAFLIIKKRGVIAATCKSTYDGMNSLAKEMGRDVMSEFKKGTDDTDETEIPEADLM